MQHLAEQLRLADTQREAELRRQAQYMSVAAAEAAVGERMRQSEDLDQVSTPLVCALCHSQLPCLEVAWLAC